MWTKTGLERSNLLCTSKVLRSQSWRLGCNTDPSAFKRQGYPPNRFKAQREGKTATLDRFEVCLGNPVSEGGLNPQKAHIRPSYLGLNLKGSIHGWGRGHIRPLGQ